MADLEGVVRGWAAAYTEEVAEFAPCEVVSDSQVFGEVYHALIHSPLSMTLLQLEATYAAAVEAVCRERDQRLGELEARQARELGETLAAAGEGGQGAVSEGDVTALAQHQVDERQLVTSKFESEVEALMAVQRREFRDWVMTVHAEYRTSAHTPGPVPRSESSFSLSSQPEVQSLQESFTITLGAQRKAMHNLRLTAAHAMDLLRFSPGEEGLPQRLQTCMSLYSTNLSALVVLTDRVGSSTGVEGELAALTARSTEFHFPPLAQQVEGVRGDVKRSAAWRGEYWGRRAAQEAALGEGQGGEVRREHSTLHTGDFYLTRHSNLCETHVVFHLLVDDSIDSPNLSSRHPAILGLRNLLKTACLNDMTSVSVPLLLKHTMTEKMTVSWCLRRAELVFKCLKGFMMEMGGWGGSELKTLQFLLPAAIDQAVFLKLTAMLATIFRVSSAIRG